MLTGEIAAGKWEYLAPAVRAQLFQDAFGSFGATSSAASNVAYVCEALVRRWGCASIGHLGDRLSIRLDPKRVFHALTGGGVGANPSLQLALMEFALARLGQRPQDLASRSRSIAGCRAPEAETKQHDDQHAIEFVLPTGFSREWAEGNHDRSLALMYGVPETRLRKFKQVTGEAKKRPGRSSEYMRGLSLLRAEKVKAAARVKNRRTIEELVRSHPRLSRKAADRLARYAMRWMRANDAKFLDQVLPARVRLTKSTLDRQASDDLTTARAER
jgi:hypothetical protein